MPHRVAPSELEPDPVYSKAILPDETFINNSNDVRNLSSGPHRDLLIEAGCDVMVHDPHVLEYPDVSIIHELDVVVKGLMWRHVDRA